MVDRGVGLNVVVERTVLEVSVDGADNARGDGVVDEADEIRSEELGAAEWVANDDGPGDDGPGASEVLAPSVADEPWPAAAAAAASWFFFS